ncbi:hypothetical protein N9B94_04125, partial [Verrucomicrobia bacterium]|nr:hypothetical protein [Verrucomicrobiota bacterium]
LKEDRMVITDTHIREALNQIDEEGLVKQLNRLITLRRHLGWRLDITLQQGTETNENDLENAKTTLESISRYLHVEIKEDARK